MTLMESIKQIQDLKNQPEMKCFPKYCQAIELSIEALKWRALMERDYGSWCGALLPGQTKDD